MPAHERGGRRYRSPAASRKVCRNLAVMALFGVLLGGRPALAAVPVEVSSGGLAGMGGIGSPITGNTDTMDWNPAALGETKYRLQFSVIPASAQLASDDWLAQDVWNLLTGVLPPEERRRLIGEIKDGRLSADFRLRGGALGTIGRNGVGASLRLHVQGDFTPDLTEYMLSGNMTNQKIDHAGSGAEMVLLGDYSISSVYSDPWLAQVLHITGFHMGGTLRVLQGLNYREAATTGEPISVVQQNGKFVKQGGGDIVSVRSNEGWGLSVDTGLFLRLTPAFAIDASLLDLGQVWWTDCYSERYTFQVDPVTGTGVYRQTEQQPVDMIKKWGLPTRFRVGVTAASGEHVLWSLQYARQLAGAAQDEAEWVLGIQLQRIKMLPLRMSARYIESSRRLLFSFGLGLELGPLTLDIGTSDLGSILGMGKQTGLAVTTGLRF